MSDFFEEDSQDTVVKKPVSRRKPMTPAKRRQRKIRKIKRIIGRTLACILGTVLMIIIGLYFSMLVICKGPSPSAKNMFVSTVLETGALKFLANVYFSKDEILEITNNNKMGKLEGDVNKDLIDINDQSKKAKYKDNFDENGVEIERVVGRTFVGQMMKVKDPSKVSVATIYPWSTWSKEKNGYTLDKLVQSAGAIGGVNGGMYQSAGNWGGMPMGVVVSDGQLLWNEPAAGDVLIGFNTDNILIVKEVGDMSEEDVKKLVVDDKIRDAVTFKDIDDGDDNHFAKLILNGESISVQGSGSGANPRTAIGQRDDGTVLIFVCDGRAHEGHAGATADDLVRIMEEYGAVNAANIDGGSSTSMYYKDEFLVTSCTLYFESTSWNLPDGFVVKK